MHLRSVGKGTMKCKKNLKINHCWEEMAVEIIKSTHEKCDSTNYILKSCDLAMSQVCANKEEVTQNSANHTKPLPSQPQSEPLAFCYFSKQALYC
jgi:hypothetical protein